MDISNKDKKYIKETFNTIIDREELVNTLNIAKEKLFDNTKLPIKLNALCYYANPKLCTQRYRTFKVPKKSGDNRIIHSPVRGLKVILKSLNVILKCVDMPSKFAKGFVDNQSIVENAKPHVGHNYVYNIDLKDFFHSFDRNRVKLLFMYEPFNLRGEKEPLAFLLSCLTTHPIKIDGKERIVLPQGSPTSPTLTNLLCKDLDRRLNGLAKRFGLTYTRYADDITFSSDHNVYNDEVFSKELRRIIEDDQDLIINPNKTRLQKNGYRKEVTGLVVNEKVNVTRRYVKTLRMWLYYWETYGYSKAEEIFRKDYIKDKGHVKNMVPSIENVLEGKLEYLRMVKGGNNSTYIKLMKRYSRLAGKLNPVNEVLQIWEEAGIDEAIQSKAYQNYMRQ